jgi:hypothetical protein
LPSSWKAKIDAYRAASIGLSTLGKPGASDPASGVGADTVTGSTSAVEAASAFSGSPGTPESRPVEKAQRITVDQVLIGRPSFCAPVINRRLEQFPLTGKHKIFHEFYISLLLQDNFSAKPIFFTSLAVLI